MRYEKKNQDKVWTEGGTVRIAKEGKGSDWIGGVSSVSKKKLIHYPSLPIPSLLIRRAEWGDYILSYLIVSCNVISHKHESIIMQCEALPCLPSNTPAFPATNSIILPTVILEGKPWGFITRSGHIPVVSVRETQCEARESERL